MNVHVLIFNHLHQVLIHQFFDRFCRQGMKIGTPIRDEIFDQNPFVIFAHLHPSLLDFLVRHAHVIAKLLEQKLLALIQGLLPFQYLGAYFSDLCSQFRGKLRIAEAAFAAA